ncbi:hypothetical protein GCM10017772_11210 [Promicromonospora soli]|uniref:Uncharacterized protein n=1 Tax=Promicromonospora soli TaxID=2035533 RepID=A0A919FL03_9MICO|nr:hypothetical protein GCM10017772_11210 [Promicromonospora soli]
MIAARPTVAVLATEPRAPTNQIPVRAEALLEESSWAWCIVAPRFDGVVPSNLSGLMAIGKQKSKDVWEKRDMG